MSKKQSENLKIFFLKKAIYTIVAIVIAIIILIILGLTFLKSYTQHGEYVNVPVLKGMDMDLAKKIISNSGLKYELIDSVYVKGAKPGSVVEIIPEENSKVKKNRVLYLKTQKLAKQMVTIPQLKDSSEDVAINKLKALGINKNRIKTEYTPSQYKTINEVLNNNKLIEPPIKVPIDDVNITLIVGDGSQNIDNDENDFDDDNIYNDVIYFE